ncbi:RNA recognition motif domain - like 10 [Theobroma cacao]|nr:RNA recognition motif domain - like 10 [Theobroma cacao]
MGRWSRRKEKHEKGGELPQHDSHEGTSARTRPFSYDEIMFKRNNRKLNENAESVKEGNTEVGKIAKVSVIQNDSNVNNSEGGHRHGKDFSPGDGKRLPEELEKRNSHKKGENASRRKDSLSNQKNRENHASEKKLKSEVTKDIGVKDEGKYEKQIHVKRTNERPAGGFETIYAKKHSRDLVERDRHAGRMEGKYERDGKRKYQTRDDEENRERSTAKKHDMQKGHPSETIERRERKESSRSHYEESHHKRRRSYSREREHRHRRSISLSPQAHKRASHHVSKHEPFSHGLKERSGRQNFDDRSRMTSNGSSGHHRRHGGFTSGLGGYSPRKRKTEAAVRTPSPVHRSTEKRTAKWDLVPAEAEKIVSGSLSSNLQASSQTVSLNMHAVVSAVPSVSTTGKPHVVSLTSSLSWKHNVSVDSVQLTEATRPMRRLYVENVPASASEKAIMESLNNFLLSSGINHIPGAQPCISCIIHKGKGQALVEFLTPEDASAALSFDGSIFSGSILKIRRPKDFVEVTGELEKFEAVTKVSDFVKDSHHKIFIGGISKAISCEMLVEIANAFGPLKAYHFEINEDLGDQYAILEYVDESVTLKACAGLNGMKLGGQVITAVQAVPNGSSLGNGGDRQSCVIPQHARPLLQKPTQVLKLKSLFPEDFSSLSEAEAEEVLEDVRLECARFGTIKSVNIVKHANAIIATGDKKIDDNTRETGARRNLENDEINVQTETMEEVTDGNSGGTAQVKFPSDADEEKAGDSINDEKPLCKLVDNESCRQGEFEGDINKEDINRESLDTEPCQPGGLDSNIAAGAQVDTELAVEDLASETVAMTVSQEVPKLMNASKEESDYYSDRNADNIKSVAINVDEILAANESNLEEVNGKLPEGCPNAEVAIEDPASKSVPISISQEIPRMPRTEEQDSQFDKVADNVQIEVINVEKKLVPKEDLELKEVDGKLPEAVDGSAGGVKIESDTIEQAENKENNLQQIFEPGCVFVEYRRIEASCMAAHCIHGRLFDDRIVTVEYIDPDLYRLKFPK